MEFLILLGILVLIFRNRKHPNKKQRNLQSPKKFEEDQWRPEWVWDEQKQLWIHPRSGDTLSASDSRAVDSTVDDSKTDSIDYSNSYQAKYLLTNNEWHQYQKLKEIADVKGYVICPKVRLLDFIEPKRGEKKYKTLLYKIQAKHVDFLICDANMTIKAVVEIDDSSHERKDRKDRDEFVDLILRSVGYKVIHTRYVTNDILDLI
ncbi:MAG: DUF2726 domain-containing protein [Faecousia sp.]